MSIGLHLRQQRGGNRIATGPRRQARIRQQHRRHLGAGRAAKLLQSRFHPHPLVHARSRSEDLGSRHLERAPTPASPVSVETSLKRRAAAHESWARTPNRRARTAKATAAFLEKFARQVDPDNKLTPEERHRRAVSARRAYYLRLSVKAAAARKARKAARG